MRRPILSTLCAILLLVVGGAAPAAVVDFESFALGGNTYLDVGAALLFEDVDGSGVDMTIAQGADNRIYDLARFGRNPNVNGQALIDFSWPEGSNDDGTTILFSSAISSFSLIAGDFGSDSDGRITIEAYDAADNMVASDSVRWMEGTEPPFAALGVEADLIRKVVYHSGGTYANSTFMDDLTFTPVPEPSTALLLGMGLVAVAVRSKSRR